MNPARLLAASILLTPTLVLAQPGVAPAEERLRAVLRAAHAGELAGRQLRTRHESTPLGVLVTAFVDPGLYPGTGVATGVVDRRGRLVGQHGTVDLGAHVRALGWRTSPPSAETFQQLLSHTHYEAQLAARGASVQRRGADLVFECTRLSVMRAEPIETIRIVVGARGDARMTTAPITGPPPPSHASVLRDAAAGRSVSATGLMRAIDSVQGTSDPAVMAQLAQISAIRGASGAIPGAAIDAIGASREAARLLSSAWAPLPAAQRASLLEVAEALHSTAFRRQIEHPGR